MEGFINMFTPKPVMLVVGAFVCDFDPKDPATEFMDGEEAAEDAPTCEILCRNNPNCNFFFDGETLGTKQCRMYKSCNILSRETGSEGKLMAMPTGQYCRVADP